MRRSLDAPLDLSADAVKDGKAVNQALDAAGMSDLKLLAEKLKGDPVRAGLMEQSRESTPYTIRRIGSDGIEALFDTESFRPEVVEAAKARFRDAPIAYVRTEVGSRLDRDLVTSLRSDEVVLMEGAGPRCHVSENTIEIAAIRTWAFSKVHEGDAPAENPETVTPPEGSDRKARCQWCIGIGTVDEPGAWAPSPDPIRQVACAKCGGKRWVSEPYGWEP